MELTLEEIAHRLELSTGKLERWIRQGKIPIVKSGNLCTFNRAGLERWAQNHNLSFERGESQDNRPSEPGIEDLLPAMKRGGVFHAVEGLGVQSVLESAVGRMSFLDNETKRELYERLFERERLNSTGIGNGVAIPHPRSPLPHRFSKPSMTTCFLKEPVDFGAVDDTKVFVLFILLSPTVKIHLHLLSRMAFCLRDDRFIAFLESRPGEEALFERIEAFENHLDTSEAS